MDTIRSPLDLMLAVCRFAADGALPGVAAAVCCNEAHRTANRGSVTLTLGSGAEILVTMTVVSALCEAGILPLDYLHADCDQVATLQATHKGDRLILCGACAVEDAEHLDPGSLRNLTGGAVTGGELAAVAPSLVDLLARLNHQIHAGELAGHLLGGIVLELDAILTLLGRPYLATGAPAAPAPRSLPVFPQHICPRGEEGSCGFVPAGAGQMCKEGDACGKHLHQGDPGYAELVAFDKAMLAIQDAAATDVIDKLLIDEVKRGAVLALEACGHATGGKAIEEAGAFLYQVLPPIRDEVRARRDKAASEGDAALAAVCAKAIRALSALCGEA